MKLSVRFRSRTLTGFAALLLWGVAVAVGSARQAPPAAAPRVAPAPRQVAAAVPQAAATGSAETYAAVITRYCVGCHNERTRTGGFVLDPTTLKDAARHPDVWEKVVRKLQGGMMPPAGAPRPDPDTYRGMVSWLESTLDAAYVTEPTAGRSVLRRLNRTEYANAVRDLVGLDMDPAALLPPDNAAYGFDNNADALSLSPALLEQYVSAAAKITTLAIGDPSASASALTFRARQDLSQNVQIEGLPLGTVGGLLATPSLPADGEYDLQVRLMRTNLGVMRGLEFPHQLEITVDGQRVHLASFGGDADFAGSLANQTKAADDVEARLRVKVRMTAGPHAIGVAFLARSAAQGSLRLQPFVRSSADPIDVTGFPHVDVLTVTGPASPTGVSETPSRTRIFTCRPSARLSEEACADRILTRAARLAFRRPITRDETDKLLGLFAAGRRDGGFEGGIAVGLQAILASPKFVFRLESDSGARPGTMHRVSDLELATRLSFFLWSSIPDETLLDLAQRGRLSNDTVLRQQIERMTADPRASLVSGFASQWLYLRNLRSAVPNSNEFPDFDDNLRQSFRRETELLFETVIRENRSVLDLLRADFTFVNERLARHYGIPNVYGSEFRRVRVPSDARRGLLGQGSILTVTSHADRTSPVVRGKWILENLLGAPVPAPPPNVPALEASDGDRPRTMRARMEAHRANPSCASCHRLMDPLGFAMENFDAVGAWRTEDAGTEIDVSGQLTDGTQVNGAAQLRDALLARPQMFVQTMTEKLLIYALGRGIEPREQPLVRAIVSGAARDDYRFSTLLMGVINSTPFRMRTVPDGEAVPSTAQR